MDERYDNDPTQVTAPPSQRTRVIPRASHPEPAPERDTAGYGAAYRGAHARGSYDAPSLEDTAPRRPIPPQAAHPYAPRASAAYGAPPAAPAPQRPAEPKRQRPRRRARHGCLSALLWLVMFAVLAVMAARCLPTQYADGRIVPELVSFVTLLFAPLAVIVVLALWWRRRLLAVVGIAALAVMLWWHQGYIVPGARVSDAARTAVATSADTGDNAARIMTLNTLNGRASAAEIVQVCQSQHIEVLCLQELSDGMIDDLNRAGIADVLPYRVVSAGASAINNGGRNAIFSRAPLSNTSRNLLPIDTSSMPAGTIQIGGRAVRIVAVHPNSPVRGAQDVWRDGLSVIASLSDYDHAYLIMGDFNATWNHTLYRELLGSTFADAGATAGEGFHMTYPSNEAIPPLVEIDHIAYSKNAGIVVSDLETVEIAGTDHMALVATLEVS